MIEFFETNGISPNETLGPNMKTLKSQIKKQINAVIAIKKAIEKHHNKLMGSQLNGSPSEDLVSFFFCPDNFVIHFFKKETLESSLEGKSADLKKGNEVTFSLVVEGKEEYNHWDTEINKAGGEILFDSNKDRKPFYVANGFFVFTDPINLVKEF